MRVPDNDAERQRGDILLMWEIIRRGLGRTRQCDASTFLAYA